VCEILGQLPRKAFLSRPLAILLAFAAGTSACGGGWHRIEDLTPRALPTRAQVQVWQNGNVILLHGVNLEPGALDGVPFTEAPECDSCRVQLPFGVVDSLRLGNKERGFFRTAGLVLGIGAVWAYLTRGIGGS
jgi:hypothetical protein